MAKAIARAVCCCFTACPSSLSRSIASPRHRPDTGRAKWLAEYLCQACGRAAPRQPPATRTCAACGGSWILDELRAAIFNFHIGQVGGIREGRTIAAMAEAHHLQIAPRVYNGPQIAAAWLQLSLCCQNVLIRRCAGKTARCGPRNDRAWGMRCASTWRGGTRRRRRGRLIAA